MSPCDIPPGRPDGLPPATRLNAEGRPVVDAEQYTPYFLTSVYSSLSRGASSIYLKRFGVGVTEWRVLSWIATEPGVTASRICEVIALDKAAVSRAVAKLLSMDMLIVTSPTRDPRRKSLRLNEAGQQLHDQILEIALAREAQLIDGVDPDDLAAFLRVMRIMRRNVETLT